MVLRICISSNTTIQEQASSFQQHSKDSFTTVYGVYIVVKSISNFPRSRPHRIAEPHPDLFFNLQQNSCGSPTRGSNPPVQTGSCEGEHKIHQGPLRNLGPQSLTSTAKTQHAGSIHCGDHTEAILVVEYQKLNSCRDSDQFNFENQLRLATWAHYRSSSLAQVSQSSFSSPVS